MLGRARYLIRLTAWGFGKKLEKLGKRLETASALGFRVAKAKKTALYRGLHRGLLYRVIKGDTRSLDNGSYVYSTSFFAAGAFNQFCICSFSMSYPKKEPSFFSEEVHGGSGGLCY